MVRRAALQEAGAAVVRVRAARAALPVRARRVQRAHARAPRVDPPHVPGAAGAPRRRAVVARPHRGQPQALLGHPQVREPHVPDAGDGRVPGAQGAGAGAGRAARRRLLRRVRGGRGRGLPRARALALLPVRAPRARAGLPGRRRRARHRGPAQGEEGPLAPVPPLAHALLHALRRAPLLQGRGKPPRI